MGYINQIMDRVTVRFRPLKGVYQKAKQFQGQGNVL
jgi:hypothetical protein